MEQQMGLVIAGCAVFRNDEGKLLTFEYVILLTS